MPSSLFAEDPARSLAVFAHSEFVERLGELLGLPYLPLHLHEVLAGFAFYMLLYLLTGPVLRRTTKWYAKLDASGRSGVATHVASEANALITLALSFPLFFLPELGRPDNSLESRIGQICVYQPYAVFVTSLIAGYFVFDAVVTCVWIRDNGIGFALHAFAALFTFLQGCRPYMVGYAAPFLWYEASTPFVNFHWLATNVEGVVSSTAQTINGAVLILVFIVCRLIVGSYKGFDLFRTALFNNLPGVPKYVVLISFGGFTVLQALNVYWFGIMMRAAYVVLFKPKRD